jgi:hypothetical protein
MAGIFKLRPREYKEFRCWVASEEKNKWPQGKKHSHDISKNVWDDRAVNRN